MAREIQRAIERVEDARKVSEAVQADGTGRYPGWREATDVPVRRVHRRHDRGGAERGSATIERASFTPIR